MWTEREMDDFYDQFENYARAVAERPYVDQPRVDITTDMSVSNPLMSPNFKSDALNRETRLMQALQYCFKEGFVCSEFLD